MRNHLWVTTLAITIGWLGSLAWPVGALPSLPTSGKVLRLVNGDLMCYVTILDARGRQHQLGADFDICTNQKLLQKKVRLNYKSSLVSDCQSAEPCGKTRSMMLITKVRIIK
jgi:hypothetical protein